MSFLPAFSRSRRLPAVCAAALACYFSVVAILLERTRTGTDPARVALSWYVHGPGGYWMNTAMWAEAIGFLALAVAFRRSLALGGTSSAGPALLTIAACGAALAGTFDIDPMPPHFPPTTISGVVHTIGSFAAITVFAAATLVLTRHFRRAPNWRSFYPRSLVLTACFAAAFLAWFATFAVPVLKTYQGAIEDGMLAVIVLAQISMAVAAYSRMTPEPDPATAGTPAVRS